MKAWEETWSMSGSGEVNNERGTVAMFGSEVGDYERARLTSSAPEMARLLIQVNALADCYFCHADVQATESHEPDCRLVAVARKAGLPLRGMPRCTVCGGGNFGPWRCHACGGAFANLQVGVPRHGGGEP